MTTYGDILPRLLGHIINQAKEKTMKTYIGVKVVQAEPMREPQENMVPTVSDPLCQRPPREGYKVVYEDGYTSWSPKDVFDKAYVEVPVDQATELAQRARCLVAGIEFVPVDDIPAFLPRPDGAGGDDQSLIFAPISSSAGVKEGKPLRLEALDRAIQACAGSYSKKLILEAAKEFESYLRGEASTPPGEAG
jgi:hypothetical protein